MRIFLSIWFLTILFNGFSQNQSTKDSLLLVLKNSKGEDKVNTFLDLATAVEINDPLLSHNYLKEALTLSKSINYTKGIGDCYTRIGIVNRVAGNYIKAIENYNLALKTLENTEYEKELAYLLTHIGVVHVDQKHYKKAIEFYNRSMKINKNLGNDRGYSINLHTIGWVYQKLKDYNKALFFYKKSLNIAYKINSDIQIMICHSTIGQVYRMKGEYKKARTYAENNLKLSLKKNNKFNLAFAYEDLAKIYEATKEFDKAIDNATKSYYLWIKLNRMEGVRASSEILSNVYAHKKEYNNAYKFHKIFKINNDSIYNLKQGQQIADFQARYDSEKKEAENKLLRREKELKDDIIKKQQTANLFVGIGIFLLLILLIVLYVAYSQKIKSNNLLRSLNEEVNQKREEILQQSQTLKEANNKISNINIDLEKKVEERTNQLAKSNKELDAFLYHSSHDLKRPITTLKGLIEISKMTSKERESLELFHQIQLTTNHMEKLLKKLMMISEINYENRSLINTNIFEVFKEIEGIFIEEIEANNISLKIYCDEELTVSTYPQLLYYIIFNLLENSINFKNSEKPKIFIDISYHNDILDFCIKDNGIGILEEYHDKIFEMFFIGTTVSKGNGLGLYVVQKAVKQLEGEIQFESNPDNFTEFIVKIPVKRFKGKKRLIKAV